MTRSVQAGCLRDYVCKCDTCRRSCCISKDWDITLTKEEYSGICSSALPDRLRDIFDRSVRKRQNGSDESYAEIDYRNDCECAFLENGLCLWQKLTGNSIGAVCRDFPRKKVRYLDTVYVFPTCACEKIAELLLGEGGCADLEEVSSEEPLTPIISISEQQIRNRPLLKFMRELFDAQTGILRNRTYSLDERMVILTAVLFAADSMEKEGLEESIVPMMNNISRCGDDELLLNICRESACSDRQKEYIKAIYSVFLENETYGKTAQRVIAGTDLPAGERVGENSGSYLKEKQVFLENVMVSDMMYHLIPLENPGIIESAAMIVSLYIFLKANIAAAWHEGFTDEELVNITVETHRMFSHNSTVRKIEVNYLLQHQLMDLPGILSLIR